MKWKVKICEFKPCIPGSVGNLETSEVGSFCKCLNCFPHHTLWAASVPPQLLWTSCNPASLSATATQRAHARISSHHTPPALARALLSFVDRRQINTFILIKRMNSLPHTCAFNAGEKRKKEKSPRRAHGAGADFLEWWSVVSVRCKSLIFCLNICPPLVDCFLVLTFRRIRVRQILVMPERTFLRVEQQAAVTEADRFLLTWGDEGVKEKKWSYENSAALCTALVINSIFSHVFQGN